MTPNPYASIFHFNQPVIPRRLNGRTNLQPDSDRMEAGVEKMVRLYAVPEAAVYPLGHAGGQSAGYGTAGAKPLTTGNKLKIKEPLVTTSHKIRIPHIPPELIHEILAHLRGETRALKRCSLVCKAWVYPSRFYLFAEVTLDDEIVESFLAFDQRSNIIPYVRCLHLKRQSTSGRKSFWDECGIPDLTGFERLRSLKLSWFTGQNLNSQARAATFTTFTGIVQLVLIGLYHLDELMLAEIICSFPRLEVLTLGSLCLQSKRATPPRTISRHLHTLEICDNAVKLFAWISLFGNLTALRALYLAGSSGDLSLLNDLLPNLRSLERLSFLNVHFTSGYIDLSRQERLRSLRIRVIPTWYPIRCAIQTLTSITSSCMHEVIFDVLETPDTETDVGWSEVDAILQSRRFADLRTVQVNMVTKTSLYYPSSLTSFVDPCLSTAFPVRLCQCHARGILSVQSIILRMR